MKIINKKETETKTCPLLKEPCYKNSCSLYNERLSNCEISLLNYNIYNFIKELKSLLSAE